LKKQNNKPSSPSPKEIKYTQFNETIKEEKTKEKKRDKKKDNLIVEDQINQEFRKSLQERLERVLKDERVEKKRETEEFIFNPLLNVEELIFKFEEYFEKNEIDEIKVEKCFDSLKDKKDEILKYINNQNERFDKKV
jgi:hypothetical protein